MTQCARNVLITGATGAIGQALAEEYAAPGVTRTLLGRRVDALRDIAARCEARGASVREAVLDLRDREALRVWLDAQAADAPPDLAIVNAGVNISAAGPGRGEDWDEIEGLLEVNVRASLALAHALGERMRRRGAGQIALISSQAAWRGLPATPSYSGSKAALKAYGEALRDAMAPQGVRISVVMPGYVTSPMCAAMPGPKPFEWDPARAARRVRRGLEANRARISFPFPLNLGCWLLAGLPPGLSGRILGWLGYGA
ncbi:SDR family NAD(P)-dependent oxidoreductase [Achromobacter denitrificans]|uniref:SDR family NAD(P)-dependent oxidoreductase n=1 Tax=Achromobacter denitrificans TaxID=32002 RepID=UPI00240D9C5D|nr:SDR family NAD(P)-dependent oxidoreductase [Achromobacter denitrificans]WFC65401.1 SDR family NAD(P)-dependent oxidoreductase [Achromobacter denitrificans]